MNFDCIVEIKLLMHFIFFRVRLSKRRQKPGQAPSNTRLVIKHRPINEVEYKMQRYREKQLEHPGEEEDEEEPELEPETVTITRTGEKSKGSGKKFFVINCRNINSYIYNIS